MNQELEPWTKEETNVEVEKDTPEKEEPEVVVEEPSETKPEETKPETVIEVKKEIVKKEDITDLVVVSWNQMQRMAIAFAKSDLVPKPLRGNVANLLIIFQNSKELGIPPLQGINGIHVIEGKPTISPQLAIALFRRDMPKGVLRWECLEEEKATVFIARDRKYLDEGVSITWDLAKAKKMGLAGKDNYRKQLGNMLKWRAVAECMRMQVPDILKGMYFTDEIIDLPKSQYSILDTDSKANELNDKFLTDQSQET